MWTWGDAPFGHAWDAHLTDTNGPYVELMAGVFTDNQPDFAFLRPGRDQDLLPVLVPDPGHRPRAPGDARRRGPARRRDDGRRRRGPRGRRRRRQHAPAARVVAARAGRRRSSRDDRADLAPGASGSSTRCTVDGGRSVPDDAASSSVEHEGEPLVTWRPRTTAERRPADGHRPSAATEPARSRAEIGSVDELYVTGLHLDQYRHATRSPEPYWVEALRRDPGDARTHVALAARRSATAASTTPSSTCALPSGGSRSATPTPATARPTTGWVSCSPARAAPTRRGAALGDGVVGPVLARRRRRGDGPARPRRRPRPRTAVDDLPRCWSRANPGHVQARNLLAVALRRRRRPRPRRASPRRGTLALDPLDAWARTSRTGWGEHATTHRRPDGPLDVALEHASASARTTRRSSCSSTAASLPTVSRSAQRRPARVAARAPTSSWRAATRPPPTQASQRAPVRTATWCFPSAAEDDALARLRRARPDDPLLAGLAGHRLYAAGRRDEAVEAWQASADADEHRPRRAPQPRPRRLQRARRRRPRGPLLRPGPCARPGRRPAALRGGPARAVAGARPAERVATLLERADLVAARDDLRSSSPSCSRPLDRARRGARRCSPDASFQPWEGGEGPSWRPGTTRTAALARSRPSTRRPGRRRRARAGRARARRLPRRGPAPAGQHRRPAPPARRRAGRGGREHEAAQRRGSIAAAQQGDFQGMQVQRVLRADRSGGDGPAPARPATRRTAAARRPRPYVAEQATVVARGRLLRDLLADHAAVHRGRAGRPRHPGPGAPGQLAVLDDARTTGCRRSPELAQDPLTPDARAVAPCRDAPSTTHSEETS